ncbi:MAG TPA: hypothetical protein VLM11_13650 [Streptosporangiaceae bacterium]|nr:hypothetical protein [Streptosporangiaceae bacterium]
MTSALHDLWGGYQESLTFDSTTRVLDLEVSTHHAGGPQTWRLRLTGVREFHVERPDDAWERTEVTELYVSDQETYRQIEIVYWTEPNDFSARFKDYELVRVA